MLLVNIKRYDEIRMYLLLAESLTAAGDGSRGPRGDLGGAKSARLRGMDLSSVEFDGELMKLVIVLVRLTFNSGSLKGFSRTSCEIGVALISM